MNYACVSGRLTRDVEMQYLPSGKAVAEITIAVDGGKNPDGSNKTVWLAAVAWDKTAEHLSKFFHKGKAILVSGYITQDEWDDKETGKKQSKTKLTITRTEFFEARSDNQQQPQQQVPQAQAPQQQPDLGYQQPQQPQPQVQYQQPQAPAMPQQGYQQG